MTRHGDVAAARSCAVIVPSRSAAAVLRVTLENHRLRGGAPASFVLPEIVTRAELYTTLHCRLPNPPPRLSDVDRQVLMAAACRRAVDEGAPPPFQLRPALVGAIVDLHDQIRRQSRTLEQFERLLVGDLESAADIDRGAERLLRQTRFLAASFREYEARVEASGAVDEHALRARLIDEADAVRPLLQVVVTMPDSASAAGGLWPADYDLLARIPRLVEIDIVATERELAAGYLERVRDRLPEIEEVGVAAGEEPPSVHLVCPAGGEERVCTARDREEELAAIARRLKSARRGELPVLAGAPLDRTAVVFKRPLPYLYLARDVFGSAGIPYQAFDTLPLAAEPYAAAVDLVLSLVGSDFSRSALVALLRSPHFAFFDGDTRVEPAAVDCLERVLVDLGFLSGLEALGRAVDRIERLAAGSGRSADRAAGALAAARAARTAASALAAVVDERPCSEQMAALLGFLRACDRPPSHDHDHERHQRTRSAVQAGLAMLIRAHQLFDDPPCDFDTLASTVRRWIEGQTFAPRAGAGGLHLVDAASARYGDFDAVSIVGLVEGEWPQAATGNVFYSAALLGSLGWTSDRDRLASERAAFADLLALPTRALSLSTFSLEHDAIVEPSSLVDLAESLPAVEARSTESRARIFQHEALSERPDAVPYSAGPVAAWAAFRRTRSAAHDSRYHGAAGPAGPRPYAVARLDTYLTCPFKYFASDVLGLDEERDEDEEIMTPRERGTFIHEVFEAFFEAWQRDRGGAITPDRIDAALALFTSVIEPYLVRLSDAEAALERTSMLGSAVATGMAEAVFRMEAERPAPVVERLLEYRLEGAFDFEADAARRRVELRGVVDRIDLLADSTLRILDYKSGRAPQLSRSLQLQVYSLCAATRLDGYRGERWRLAEAAYLAFRGPAVVPLFPRPTDRDRVLAEGAARLVEIVQRIEQGEFPVKPHEPFLCSYCAYPGVCRKDYVGDD